MALVPAAKPSSASWFLAGRAVLALLLMAGFYLLAVGLAAALIAVPIAEVTLAGGLHLKLALLCIVAAAIILWSVMPRPDRFAPPGPLLLPDKHPELFGVIGEVAHQTGQAMPAEVYLVPDLNAFVTQRGGLMGFGSRRVLGLGLPLMEVLNVGQLRAVLAHEFGHFHGGDTRLGPFVHNTRGAIGRAVAGLGAAGGGFFSLVQVPFTLYAKLFMTLTLAVSRAQEYSADKLAALTQGARPLRQGLEVIHSASLAYQAYFQGEVAPALHAGFRPPYANGFARFVAQDGVRQALDRALASALKEGETDTNDSHPALKDRLAALADLPDGEIEDNRRATSLLSDLPGAEHELLASLFEDRAQAARLQQVTWEEVGARVYLPAWKKLVAEHHAALAGLTPRTLPVGQPALAALGRAALGTRAGNAPDQALAGFGVKLVGAALATSLADRGWGVDAGPGHAVVLIHGEQRLEVFDVVTRLENGTLRAEDWEALVREAGIAELDLGAGPAELEAGPPTPRVPLTR